MITLSVITLSCFLRMTNLPGCIFPHLLRSGFPGNRWGCGRLGCRARGSTGWTDCSRRWTEGIGSRRSGEQSELEARDEDIERFSAIRRICFCCCCLKSFFLKIIREKRLLKRFSLFTVIIEFKLRKEKWVKSQNSKLYHDSCFRRFHGNCKTIQLNV